MVSCAILSIIWYKDPFTLSWGGACLLDFRRPFSTIFLFFTVMQSVNKGEKIIFGTISYLYWTWIPWPHGQKLPRARFHSPSGAVTSSRSFFSKLFHQSSFSSDCREAQHSTDCSRGRGYIRKYASRTQRSLSPLQKSFIEIHHFLTIVESAKFKTTPSYWRIDRNKSKCKWHRVGRSSIEPHYTPFGETCEFVDPFPSLRSCIK